MKTIFYLFLVILLVGCIEKESTDCDYGLFFDDFSKTCICLEEGFSDYGICLHNSRFKNPRVGSLDCGCIDSVIITYSGLDKTINLEFKNWGSSIGILKDNQFTCQFYKCPLNGDTIVPHFVLDSVGISNNLHGVLYWLSQDSMKVDSSEFNAINPFN